MKNRPGVSTRLNSLVARMLPGSLGLRFKLILLFVVIKVFPLVLLAVIAAKMADDLGQELGRSARQMGNTAEQALGATAGLAVSDSVRALDARAREDIERLTTDTANRLADFLYERDGDIRLAASLPIGEASYKAFMDSRSGLIIENGEWAYDEAGKVWLPKNPATPQGDSVGSSSLADNAHAFHYRAPDDFKRQRRPLYLEITFVDLNFRERIKVVRSSKVDPAKKNISRPENTFAHSERYAGELARLAPGQIYVSEVIGEYVRSKVVGTYTPEAAAEAGEPFDPAASAYAGKENPLGKRFAGLIRWATPVTKDGRIVGYVTLALDHDHLMEFTNHLMPTTARYTGIPDASEGNYAFIWDHLGRNIVHPRHYFITGYNAKTGLAEVPWLEEDLYDAWMQSGKSFEDFSKGVPVFHEQSLKKRNSAALAREGTIGLDCRYLNAAPQCTGWFELSKHGGSGSFVILWSGLWKLTTAAAIPYYTGQYASSPRGFGVVTIGANVDEFHAAANETEQSIGQQIQNTRQDLRVIEEKTQHSIADKLFRTSLSLSLSTAGMCVLVILLAIWLAFLITRRITAIIDGISRFRAGERDFRFNNARGDEMGALADCFDGMANSLDAQLTRLEEEIAGRERFERELIDMKGGLEDLVDSRTKDLSELNLHLSRQIEERCQAEAQVRHLADHDPLTGLPNRRFFQACLEGSLEKAKANNSQVALLYCDLNFFKKVNDNFGHAVGDELLRIVAERMKNRVASADMVSRLGGDEFAVLLHESPSLPDIEAIAGRLIEAVAEPMIARGHQVRVGVSIGIALFPDNSLDASQMFMHADLAMYKAKTEGGNRFCHFTPAMRLCLREKTAWEQGLRNALLNQELKLYYQPRFDLETRSIVGIEALLRWQHPQHGLLSPGSFLDVATQCGILPEIDDWVLAEACAQANRFDEQGFPYSRMAVNVSAKELVKPGYAAKFFKTAERAGVDLSSMGIEITEHVLIEDYNSAKSTLQSLREQSVQIAIDDFGVAHSSLQRLIECPIDMIKIDRFFVSRINESEKSEAVIKAMIVMARQTGLSVVAEGVETSDQLDFLKSCGCHIIQGYIYAKPLSPNNLMSWTPPS
jgi:diguanylate cyclase (GGDEF)-like protein